jgi:hypothetical protein
MGTKLEEAIVDVQEVVEKAIGMVRVDSSADLGTLPFSVALDVLIAEAKAEQREECNQRFADRLRSIAQELFPL